MRKLIIIYLSVSIICLECGYSSTKNKSNNQAFIALQTYYLHLNADTAMDKIMIGKIKNESTKIVRIIINNNEPVDYVNSDKIDQIDSMDWNWIDTAMIIKKSTTIFSSVDDEGNIISEEEVSENKKVLLQSEALLLLPKEGCGGVYLYYQNGKLCGMQAE
jgi:hypothetical protein